MASDSMKTLRLLLCITGLLNGNGNISNNESDSSYDGGQGLTPLLPVSNGTGSGSRNTGTTWLRELIKTRLVKCRRRLSFPAGENRRRGPAWRLEVRGLGQQDWVSADHLRVRNRRKPLDRRRTDVRAISCRSQRRAKGKTRDSYLYRH